MATRWATPAIEVHGQENNSYDISDDRAVLAGLRRSNRSHLGLSKQVVHFWAHHRVDFERCRRFARFDCDDPRGALCERFYRGAHGAPAPYRSGPAIYDLPADPVCGGHDRQPGRGQAGVRGGPHVDQSRRLIGSELPRNRSARHGHIEVVNEVLQAAFTPFRKISST